MHYIIHHLVFFSFYLFTGVSTSFFYLISVILEFSIVFEYYNRIHTFNIYKNQNIYPCINKYQKISNFNIYLR